ncbi:unnamed protein product [Prorocentrum cordatum]|uniref:Dual-specificity kinase n=1 Tax=Prorocentrum cordatum TaxID=2364126 RepID=A0ABN9UIP5_9DINO|nr:unnamed protein product [Polarella glacialis]
MELKGKIPGKVIKKGAVWKNHFTDDLDFKHLVDDPGSGQQVTKIITDLNATRSLKDLVMERVGKEKQQSEVPEDQAYCKRAVQFADLLERMTALDPANRIRPDDALQHAFLQEPCASGDTSRASSAMEPPVLPRKQPLRPRSSKQCRH